VNAGSVYPTPRLIEVRGLVDGALKSGACADSAALEAAALEVLDSDPNQSAAVQLAVDAAFFLYVSGRPQRGYEVSLSAKNRAFAIANSKSAASALNMLGICAADTGNLPAAMDAYSQALTLSIGDSDFLRQGKVWQNLGAALVYLGLFREAIACFYKTIELSETNVELAPFVRGCFTNIALCHLHLDETSQGLGAINKAIVPGSDPSDAHSIQNRVLAENYFTRLLIEVNDFDGALQHARLARTFANKSKSPRADIQASVAEGLAEAFSGNLDLGISRLRKTLDQAKALRLASREVLVALVKALEFANRHDDALKYLQEMLGSQRKTAEANVLHHVEQHLIKLHSKDTSSPIEDVGQVMRRMETRAEVLEGRVAKAEVIRQRQELFKSRIEAMERLAVAAELRDDSTGEHSYRVGRMACLLAKEAGCDDETIFMIDIAARLHDVGKIGIPDGILLKPSGFNPSERLVMEMHAEIGADVLARSEIPHIKMAEEIARHHHERWDGRGYPAKIGGQEIPLAARITALADVYDALTHKRPYKQAWTVEASLSEILSLRGKHFDPELTELFLALVSRLRREHRDLDHHLGEAARASPFIQARGKIWATLKLAKDEYQQQFQRTMDLQR